MSVLLRLFSTISTELSLILHRPTDTRKESEPACGMHCPDRLGMVCASTKLESKSTSSASREMMKRVWLIYSVHSCPRAQSDHTQLRFTAYYLDTVVFTFVAKMF